MKKRTHWTISALKDFETCPAKSAAVRRKKATSDKSGASKP